MRCLFLLLATTALAADITLDLVIQDAIADVPLTFKGEGHLIKDSKTGGDTITYEEPGGPFTEEQCKERCNLHVPVCGGVAWEGSGGAGNGRCLILTDNVLLNYINEDEANFYSTGKTTLTSAGVDLTYVGNCKDTEDYACENTRLSQIRIVELRNTDLPLWRVWVGAWINLEELPPAHNPDDYLLYPETRLGSKTVEHGIWALKTYHIDEETCKDFCSDNDWCLGIVYVGDTDCNLLGNAVTLLTREDRLELWNDDFRNTLNNLDTNPFMHTWTYNRVFNRYTVPSFSGTLFGDDIFTKIGDFSTIQLHQPVGYDTWVKSSALANFTFECGTIQGTDRFCENAGAKCYYPYSSGLELEYPNITSALECRGKCTINELWCFGWEVRSGVCTLFSDKNVYYRPGTTEPFYEDLDADSILSCNQPEEACTPSQLLPYFLKPDGVSYCELHSGACSYRLRKLTEGRCRGGGFNTEKAFRVVIPSDSGTVVDECKNLCCNNDWCVAVEYRNPGQLYQECDFLVDSSNDTFPTPGLPFMEVPYKPTGDTVCYSSTGEKWLDTNSRFIYSGKEQCESFNGHPGKTVDYTEAVDPNGLNKQDYCAAKCYDTDGCLGFEVDLLDDNNHDCKVNVVDTDAPVKQQTVVIRGTGADTSLSTQCWIDKDFDFYAPLPAETYTQVGHHCDIAGVKQVIHEFNYNAASVCSTICTNNPKMCRGWHSPGSNNMCALAVNWDYLNRAASSHYISGHHFENHCEQETCTLEDNSAITSESRATTSVCNVRPGYVTPPPPPEDSDNTLAIAVGCSAGGLALLICCCCVFGEPPEEEGYENV